MFKYKWIWEKAVGSNFATLKYQPMKEHENILVFGKGTLKYNPQMQPRKGSGKERSAYTYKSNTISGDAIRNLKTNRSGEKYDENKRNPSSVQYFNNREKDRGIHPTQKPVALGRYLIRTYTNEGNLILDNTCGSGSFLVAAVLEKRNFIGIELDEKYCEIARERIKNLPTKLL